jgi:hypothetical protein
MKTLPNSEILPETLFRKLFITVKESNFVSKNFPLATFLTFTYTLVDFSSIQRGLDSEEMGQRQRRRFVSVFLYAFCNLDLLYIHRSKQIFYT